MPRPSPLTYRTTNRVLLAAGLLLVLAVSVRLAQAQDPSPRVAEETAPTQTLTEEQLDALRQGAAEATLPEGSVTVPLVGTPTLPLVETRIGGAGPFRLLVDLGSNVTLLRRDVVDAAGIEVVLDRDASDIVHADTLSIGAAVFRDVWMGAYDELDVDGVVGYNLLDTFPFVLDLAAQSLTLGRSDATDTDPQYVVKDRLPYFPARIGDREVLLNPDTGASEEMTVPAAWEGWLPLEGMAEPGPVTRNNQTGATRVRVGRLAVDLRVGDHTLRRPLVCFNPDAEDAWLGSGLLRRYVLSVDPERDRFRLEPSPSSGPPSWGELVAGTHMVGFRVFRTLDRSRGYWPLRNYRGEPNPLPTERPIQIAVWYPATPGPNAEPMAFRDYVELQATALGEHHAEELRPLAYRELRDDMLGRYFPPDGPDDAQLEAVLGQPTAAYRDAPAAAGSFPLVIHSGFGPFAQSVLLEYLASHGYVVVTTHMLGSSPAWFHRGSDTLEWWTETARDVAFLRAFAAELETADPRRAAVIGMTAAAGLLDQMDSMHLSALAGIEASYPDLLLEAPGFEPARVRIPVLDVVSSGNTRTEAMLDRLVFADRWLVRFDAVDHVAMYQFQRLAGAEPARRHRGYTVTARITRRFLDAHLKDDGRASGAADWAEAAGAEIPAGFARIEHRSGEPPIPTEHELLLLVRQGRAEEATRAYREAARRGHPRFFDAGALRTVAIFRLLDDGDPEGATAAFRILVEAYPEDPHGWRWLGRSLDALGDPDAAREALERALELAVTAELPADERASLQERIEADLERLAEQGE